ncbi:MAG: TldD/PmbA family protein [Candidatus Cloacimonetes bacterium]|nr:TldD/PmbA family protein [Candidatus Cloacimonadota bacterium]
MYEKEFQFIFNYASSKADDIEILLSSNKSFSVKIHNQEIESFNYADAKGIGVRVIKDDKVGYAYTEEFNEKTLRVIVDQAVENSSFSEDADKIEFSSYPDIPRRPRVYSRKLDAVDVASKIDFTKKVERIAREADKRIINVPFATFGDGRSFIKIANSRGLHKEDRQNYAYAVVGVLAAEKDDKRAGFDFIISRNFSDFDPHKLAVKSVEKAIGLLGGREIASGGYPIIFNNEMMATMLATFSSIFSAQSVQEGKSLLKGRLNKIIASNKVTIIDDALHKKGFSTRSFDSEGYPSQKTVLIDKGKLIGYLHNTITARKDRVSSTGNAARDYKGILSVSPTNFFLKPGNVTSNELYSRHARLIEIVSLQGMHAGANTISGDFSLSAEGFLYEQGERKDSLKQFTVSGNILQMLKDVEDIADDFIFDTSACGSASVLIKKLAVSSR